MTPSRSSQLQFSRPRLTRVPPVIPEHPVSRLCSRDPSRNYSTPPSSVHLQPSQTTDSFYFYFFPLQTPAILPSRFREFLFLSRLLFIIKSPPQALILIVVLLFAWVCPRVRPRAIKNSVWSSSNSPLMWGNLTPKFFDHLWYNKMQFSYPADIVLSFSQSILVAQWRDCLACIATAMLIC